MLDEIGTDNFKIHDNYIEIMEIINFKVDYELNHIKKEDVLDSEQKLEHEANVKILEKLKAKSFIHSPPTVSNFNLALKD